MKIDDILNKIKQIQILARPDKGAASSSYSQIAASSSDTSAQIEIKQLLSDLNEQLQQAFQQNEDLLKQAKQYIIQISLGLQVTPHDTITLKQSVTDVFGEEFADVIEKPIKTAGLYPRNIEYPNSFNHRLYDKLFPLCQLGYLLERNGVAAEHAFKLAVIFDNEAKALDYLVTFREINNSTYLLHDACLFELPNESACNMTWWLKLANQGHARQLKMLNRRFRAILPFTAIIEQMIGSCELQYKQQIIDELKQQPAFQQLDRKQQQKKIKQEISRQNQPRWKQVQGSIARVKTLTAKYKRVNSHWQKSPEERNQQLKQLSSQRSEALIELAKNFQGFAIDQATIYVLVAFYEQYKKEQSPVHQLLVDQGISEQSIAIFDKLIRRDDAREIPDITIDSPELGFAGFYLKKLNVLSDKGAAIAASLGKMTNCCQWLGGAGNDCVINGIESPHAGFYVMFQGDANQASLDDKVIAQAWAWRGSDDALVLDSIEASPGADKQKVATLYQYLGHLLCHNPAYPVEKVKTGERSGVTSEVVDTTVCANRSQFKDYEGYCDSQNQFLLASKSSPYLYLERVNNPQFKTQILHDTKILLTPLLASVAPYRSNEALKQLVVLAIRQSPQLKNELIANAPQQRRDELEVLLAINTQHLACLDKDIVDINLIDAGAYINEKSTTGNSALIIAVNNNDFDKVKLLVSHGAKVTIADKYRRTPLFWAAMTGNHEIFDYLFSLEEQTTIKSVITNQSLLWVAVSGGNILIIDKLLALDKSTLSDTNGLNTTVFHRARDNPKVLLRLLNALDTEQQKIDCLTQIDNDNHAVLNWINLLPILSHLSNDASVALLEKFKANLIAKQLLSGSELCFPFLSKDKLHSAYLDRVAIISHQKLIEMVTELVSDELLETLINKIQLIPNLELNSPHLLDKTLLLIVMNELPKTKKYLFLQKVQQDYAIDNHKKRVINNMDINELFYIVSEVAEDHKLKTLKLLVGDRIDYDYQTMLTLLKLLPQQQRIKAMAMSKIHGNSLLEQQVFNRRHNWDEKLLRVKNLLSTLPEKDRIKALRQKGVSNGPETIVNFCELSVDLAKLCLSMLPDRHRARSLVQKSSFERSYFPFALVKLLSKPDGFAVLYELINKPSLKKLLRRNNKAGLQQLLEFPQAFKQALALFEPKERISLLQTLLENCQQFAKDETTSSEDDDTQSEDDLMQEQETIQSSYFLTHQEKNMEHLIAIIKLFDDTETQVQAMKAVFGNTKLFNDKSLTKEQVELFLSKLPEQLKQHREIEPLCQLCINATPSQGELGSAASSSVFFYHKEDEKDKGIKEHSSLTTPKK